MRLCNLEDGGGWKELMALALENCRGRLAPLSLCVCACV